MRRLVPLTLELSKEDRKFNCIFPEVKEDLAGNLDTVAWKNPNNFLLFAGPDVPEGFVLENLFCKAVISQQLPNEMFSPASWECSSLQRRHLSISDSSQFRCGCVKKQG